MGAVSAPGVVRCAAPGWPGTRGVELGTDGREIEPGIDGGGVEPGTAGEGIPAGLEGSAGPGAERPGAPGAEVEGAVIEGGGAALPLPGLAPGICCAMLGDASPSRLPSKSMPTSKKRYILPERLWDTASSSQLPDHSHAMLACLLTQFPEAARGFLQATRICGL